MSLSKKRKIANRSNCPLVIQFLNILCLRSIPIHSHPFLLDRFVQEGIHLVLCKKAIYGLGSLILLAQVLHILIHL